jgi:hypothetical protein
MALATRTISINPAFLQEIKDDHHELRQLKHHAAAMLNRPAWMKVEHDRLLDLLMKLRDQLAMHFSLEEAYGYFEDAISVAPHLSARAERLRSEHGELFSELCRIVERAERLAYHEEPAAVVGELAEEYQVFSDHLRKHEARECELILEAFDDDIGAGD